MGRYEDYNEMLYEAYCKAAIDNAILKERMKKAAHGAAFLAYTGVYLRANGFVRLLIAILP